MPQQSIGFLIWDVSRLVRTQFHNDERMSSMTLARAKALMRIALSEGIRQVELAEQLEIKPMSLVRVVDALVEEELIERRPDPKDRRAYQLHLLPKAEPEIEKIKIVGTEIWDAALQNIPKEDVEQMIKTLGAIHTNLMNK